MVPTEDSLTAEWWETRARLSAGGLLGAGCQVGDDEDDEEDEEDEDDDDREMDGDKDDDDQEDDQINQILAGRDVACWSRRREGGGGEAAGIPSGPGSKVGFSITKGLC